MTTPDRRLLIPGGGNREDHRSRHHLLACHSRRAQLRPGIHFDKPPEFPPSAFAGMTGGCWLTPPRQAPAVPAHSATPPPSAVESSRRGSLRRGESSTSPRRCPPG